MKSERWQKLDELFHAALERAPEQRAAFLDDACALDELLRKQVEALLVAHEEAGSFINTPAFEVEAQALAEVPPDHSSSIVGQVISHYRIIDSLGAGGMGEVYLAQDITLGRQVALKLLPARFTGDGERLRRFEQEARAASALNHPNILTIYEIGGADSVRYIATEFIDGPTLRRRMDEKSIKVAEAVDVAIQIAGALAAAHTKGIVHRDIKPENVMISQGNELAPRESHVKVLDFGIAKLTEAESMETDLPTRPLVSTSEGITMGTAPYMSPEQARGLKLDARTDIWSLGVVLYEMISGHPPFEGSTRSHLIVSILEKEPQPLREVAEVPEPLEWIVMKALQKNRDERYQTARELHSDLKNLGQRLQQDRLARPANVARDRIANDLDGAPPASSTLPTGKRSYWVVASLAIISVVAVALGLKLLWPSLTGKKPAAPFSNFKVTRLTTTGKASSAVISPDGKYVVHVKELAGQYSLWIKHIATSSDKEIVSADGSQIESLSFSPDGNHIYFIKKAKNITLNEIPVLGGPTKSLVADIDTAAALSPKGDRFAFIRGDPTRDQASLITTSADGSGESKLVTHGMAEIFWKTAATAATPAWSADGKRIAFARLNTNEGNSYTSLAIVRVSDGVETSLTSEKWDRIDAICWLPDGNGLLFTATEAERKNAQIWYASYPTGVARKITNDPNNYQNLSITADGGSLVTVLSEGASDIWVVPEEDAGRGTQVTFNRFDGVGGIAWTPDGRIVHVSQANGNPDIRIMNANGSQDQPLTSNAGLNLTPRVSPDGRFVLFISNRKGPFDIWRMDTDGKQQMQLTYGESDTDPSCSLDGKWVVFTSGGEKKNSLWKVPIDGGTPMQLTEFTAMYPAVSPRDGSIAYTYVDLQVNPVRFKIGIIGAERAAGLKTFDLPQFFGTLGPLFYSQKVSWTPDGQALAYIDNKDAVGNIWAQPIAGGPPKQLTNFRSDMIFQYAWSRDGKQLAVARGSKTSDVVLISDVGGSR